MAHHIHCGSTSCSTSSTIFEHHIRAPYSSTIFEHHTLHHTCALRLQRHLGQFLLLHRRVARAAARHLVVLLRGAQMSHQAAEHLAVALPRLGVLLGPWISRRPPAARGVCPSLASARCAPLGTLAIAHAIALRLHLGGGGVRRLTGTLRLSCQRRGCSRPGFGAFRVCGTPLQSPFGRWPVIAPSVVVPQALAWPTR